MKKFEEGESLYVTETPRMLIRKFTEEDAPFILELLNTPGWLQFVGDRKIRDEEAAREYIKNVLMRGYETYGFGFWLMEARDVFAPLGMVGIVKRAELEDADIGFALLPQFEGQGFAYEASRAVMDLAKEKFMIKKLLAIAQEDNPRSLKLLEKLGMRRRGLEKVKDEFLVVMEIDLG